MEIKLRIIAAMKSGNVIEKDILRLVLSESERLGSTIDKVAEKIIESNNEVLKYRDEEKLRKENEILESLIPPKASKTAIFDLLSLSRSDIISSSEGKAIGLAIKKCKESGMCVSGDDVKSVVRDIRESVNA